MTLVIIIGAVLVVAAVILALRLPKSERAGTHNNWTNDRHLKKEVSAGGAADVSGQAYDGHYGDGGVD